MLIVVAAFQRSYTAQ